jgi:parallel beta-helix repeat protein
MAVNLSPYGGVGAQFLDNAGNVLTGGKIFTYAAGTTTNQATYTSSNGATPHPNPIILDASGRVPGGEIWLTDGLSYKFILRDANDVLIATYDNVTGINSNFIAFTNQQEIQTATAGQTVFNFTTMTYSPGTNSLSVFVDGVNQYGPGAQYAYVETDADTVTFVNGLHVGAEVKFTTSQLNSSGLQANAFQVSYTPPFTNSVGTNVGDKLAQYVSVKDFGAVGDGVTDDTTAIQAAVTTGNSVYFPVGTYLISSAINLDNNANYYGCGSNSVIITATTNISHFSATSKSNIKVSNLKFTGVAGSTSGFGAITFLTSTSCKVDNCEFYNCGYDGVLINSSNYCEVTNSYFHDFLGTTQDQADVGIINASSYNIVSDNVMLGGGWHGCLVQESNSGSIPYKNLVKGNRIGAHTAYGIAAYNAHTASDNFTTIEANYIEDITGVNPSNAGGAGIYIQQSGGAIASSNTVKNCCISTSSLTLTPAGIACNNLSLGLSPVVISGNVITDVVNYFGIEVASSVAGVSITGNTIRLVNNTANTTVGIYINAASNCVISANNIVLNATNTTTGISLYANGTDTTATVIQGNNISGGGFASVRIFAISTYINYLVTVSNNICSSSNTSNIPLRISAVQSGQVTGNVFTALTARAVDLVNATFVRFANNQVATTGTLAFITSGTCTGCYYDKTNYNGAVTFIQNAATGCLVEQFNNAAPTVSNWAIGDRIEQSVPVVGQPKGWRCTVAGVPGTWVSEGNL